MAVNPNIRAKALKQMSGQMPTQNAQMLQQQNQAAQVQAQSALAAAAPGQTSARQVQQFAGQTAATQGSNLVQAAANQAKQNTQIQGMALKEQGMQAQQTLADKEQRIEQQRLQNEQKLFNLGQNAKAELFDRRFNLDQRKIDSGYMNEMQLLDWAATNAQSEEQLRQYQQQVEQDTARATQVMKATYDLILQDLKQKQALAEQQKDQASKRRIQEAIAKAEREQARLETRAENTKAVVQGTVTVGKAFAGAM